MIESLPKSSVDGTVGRAPGHDIPATMPDQKQGEDKDPLRCNMPLLHRGVFYPLGFAVEILTNRQTVLDIVDSYWGGLRPRHTDSLLQVRIVVSDDGSQVCPPAPVVQAQRNLLTIVADAHNHAVCDLAHGMAIMWLGYAAVQFPEYVRYHFIAPIRVLIATGYTTPIHAACVARNGHGMLLSGVSGAGKSSLSFACARAGWTFTSDDGSFLLRGVDEPRVVGDCHLLRFRPSARELFPEIEGRELTPRVQGKPSIEISTAELGLTTAEQAVIRSVIFLNRQVDAVADLTPLAPGIAIERFRSELVSYPEGEHWQMWDESLQQLVDSAAIYELTYSDLHRAIERLDSLACGLGSLL